MSARGLIPLFLCSIISINSCRQIAEITTPVNYDIHIFYYGWYGNPEIDGAYNNWNHRILPHWINSTWNNSGSYPGGDDIGANYYPQLGCYSSNNPEILTKHIKQIRKAGIGTIIISWWGKDSFTDKSVSTFLDIAYKYGVKVSFHIEPIYKTVEEFKGHLEYISENSIVNILYYIRLS